MSHTRTNLLYHFIFGTKCAERWLHAELSSRLHAYLGGTVKHLDGFPLAINGMKEHVHVLARLPPTRTIADTICILKANSSKWIHETFPAWSNSGGRMATVRLQ